MCFVVGFHVSLVDHHLQEPVPVLREDAQLDANLDAALAHALHNRRTITPLLGFLHSKKYSQFGFQATVFQKLEKLWIWSFQQRRKLNRPSRYYSIRLHSHGQ